MLKPDHKLRDERVIPYTFRPHNRSAILYAHTNRYKNSFIPWSLANFQSYLIDLLLQLIYFCVHVLMCIFMF